MTNATELAAILHGAAYAPITDRAFLRITGPDATRWLNGMVTNNIKDLAPGEGNYNFLLNAQGRIQGDCNIYREPDGDEPVFLLETDKSQIETVHQFLDKFIIMDDVELAPTLQDYQSLLLIGPDAHAIIQSLGITQMLPSRIVRNTFNQELVLTPVTTLLAVPQYTVHSSSGGIAGLHALLVQNINVISPETLEAYRILSATPRYGTDIRNTETAKDLPQETAQTHALHFSKGCYLGQEIVERIHSRGQVHRTFMQFTLTGTLPTLPAPLEANGKTVGELTSAAVIPLPEGDITLALGYARREALDRHEPLAYPGGTATPRPPK